MEQRPIEDEFLDQSWDHDDEDSMSSSDYTQTSHASDELPPVESDSDNIGKKENKLVNRSKALAYLMLLLAAATVGTVTYVFTSAEEEDNFHDQYAAFAKEIIDVSEANSLNQFSAVRSLSIAVTSHVLNAPDMEWPLVSLPDFEVRSREARELSQADVIAFAPIVPQANKTDWETYSVANQEWIEEGLRFQGKDDVDPGLIPDMLFPFDDGILDAASDFYVPLWQTGQAPTNTSNVNLDLVSHPTFQRQILDLIEVKHEILSEIVDVDFLIQFSVDGELEDQPRSVLFEPVYDTFEDNAEVVGFIIAVVAWDGFFVDTLPEKTEGFLVEVNDRCGAEFTYVVDGPKATYLGEGTFHKSRFNSFVKSSEFAMFARYDGNSTENRTSTVCDYLLEVFPTELYESQYLTNGPAIYTSVIVLVFFFTAAVFILYDYTVQRRQKIILSAAQRTTAIVSSLFPKNIQQRIMQEAEDQAVLEGKQKKMFGFAPKSQLQDFLADGTQEESHTNLKSKPIADLFPDVTIMFADIVGFTAWSSMREPSQVFTLLETIYHAFDVIAKRRRVFKVETVGDCYVAVAGLPEPRKDHHTVMARFARDCMYTFNILTKKLEVSLGPDTGDLGLRTGLHSGQVTAGVLRGERARFQLFGDSVNTTARMESNGMRNKIHISQETADLLVGAGKGHWITPRAEKITAKGKGELQTYWLDLKGDAGKSQRSGSSESDGDAHSEIALDEPIGADVAEASAAKPSAGKHQRLVDWNTDILLRLLREISARREASVEERRESTANVSRLRNLEQGDIHKRDTILDEVEEIVNLPKFNTSALKVQRDPEMVDLGEDVFNQLRDYVATIAAMYRDNSFHNFEHASHVAMSTVKLLSRIVAPDIEVEDDNEEEKLHSLHDHTYGITSDPLTQFACIFSALIHDVDHVGVPNTQLIKEKSHVAAVYRNKSVAEQNSVDLAWDLLMDHNYEELRRCIYSNESEFKRFRQLVVNAVMATDIMDKDLKKLRNIRWEKAFSETSQKLDLYFEDTINRKATIVIEHLIQASDVSHTMQHWHIYRKWNERLFHEMYKAYIQGRAETDPSENWYKGEMGFFDFYIIPLAKKLKDCGVFGVSSDEYLNYAMKNRKEWELRGQEVVESMMECVDEIYADSGKTGPKQIASAPREASPKQLGKSAVEEESISESESDTDTDTVVSRGSVPTQVLQSPPLVESREEIPSELVAKSAPSPPSPPLVQKPPAEKAQKPLPSPPLAQKPPAAKTKKPPTEKRSKQGLGTYKRSESGTETVLELTDSDSGSSARRAPAVSPAPKVADFMFM